MENEKEKKANTLLLLAASMLKIGLFTFGGGYAMLSLLENEFVARRKWLTKEEFTDMTAITGSVPGSIAVNASTYIGYTVAGTAGSLAASFAVCLPSFVIIYLISLFFRQFTSFPYIAYAFRGIQVCVIYLILSAGIKMFKNIPKSPLTVTVFVLTVLLNVTFSLIDLRFVSVSFILLGGLAGVLVFAVAGKKKKE